MKEDRDREHEYNKEFRKITLWRRGDLDKTPVGRSRRSYYWETLGLPDYD